MAKTHELFLYCGAPAQDIYDAARWAAAWQHPLLLEIDSRVYADSGAWGSFPRYYPEYWWMEEKLRAGIRGSDLVGMMNFGDTGRVHSEGGKQRTYTTDNYLSGYRRAFEVAVQTGRYCARTPTLDYDITPEVRDRWNDPRQPWRYCTRTSGWALNGMAELYEALRDPDLEEPMRRMVEIFENWQDDEGRWRNVIGSFNRGSTPFMTAGILNGLMRVAELLEDEKAREMCIRGCQFLARKMVTPEGLMYYKEAPISHNGPHSSNILNFRPLAWAYAQTQDPALLRCMWRLFRWRVEQGGPSGYEVKDAFWALPTFESAGLLEIWRNEDD